MLVLFAAVLLLVMSVVLELVLLGFWCCWNFWGCRPIWSRKSGVAPLGEGRELYQ